MINFPLIEKGTMKPYESNSLDTFDNTCFSVNCCRSSNETPRQTSNSPIQHSPEATPDQVLRGSFLQGFRDLKISESFEAHLVSVKFPFKSSSYNSLDKAFALSTLSTETSK